MGNYSCDLFESVSPWQPQKIFRGKYLSSWYLTTKLFPILTCAHTCNCTYIATYLHLHEHTYIPTCTLVHIYSHACIHIPTHVHTHAQHSHTDARAHMYTHMCAFMPTHAHICAHVYTHMQAHSLSHTLVHTIHSHVCTLTFPHTPTFTHTHEVHLTHSVWSVFLHLWLWFTKRSDCLLTAMLPAPPTKSLFEGISC